MGLNENDPVAQPEISALEQGLRDSGWHAGAGIRIEYRWGAADAARVHKQIEDLVGLKSEVIISRSTPITTVVAREVKTVPVVFVQVSDPVGDGIVASLAHPGANVTGFTNIEASLAAKWVELLKQLAPITDVAFLYSPKTSPGRRGTYFRGPFESAAASLGVHAVVAPADSDSEIENAFAASRKAKRGAVIVAPGVFLVSRRELIIGLAARHRLPAIYPFTFWANLGGLMSYGSDSTDIFRRAASYVDRILKGANASDLPIQAPVKFELVINRNAAKIAGIALPQSLLLRADRTID